MMGAYIHGVPIFVKTWKWVPIFMGCLDSWDAYYPDSTVAYNYISATLQDYMYIMLQECNV